MAAIIASHLLNPMIVNANADSQIMVKEIKDKAEIGELAKDNSNNDSWYVLNKDGETKYFYITDKGKVEIHEKDPNQEAAIEYNNLEKGNVIIKVSGYSDFQSLLINLKTKNGEYLPIELNGNEIKAVIPLGEYEIDSVSIVDKNGYMKDTKYDIDKQYFKVEKGKDYNANIKITGLVDVDNKSIDDLVGEEETNKDKELKANNQETSNDNELIKTEKEEKIKSKNYILKYITTAVTLLILSVISFLSLRKRKIKGDYDD